MRFVQTCLIPKLILTKIQGVKVLILLSFFCNSFCRLHNILTKFRIWGFLGMGNTNLPTVFSYFVEGVTCGPILWFERPQLFCDTLYATSSNLLTQKRCTPFVSINLTVFEKNAKITLLACDNYEIINLFSTLNIPCLGNMCYSCTRNKFGEN